MKKDRTYLWQKKHLQQKISALTAYDFPTALIQDQIGIDLIIVGDSVGTNILGYSSETEVTVADMIHHLKAVRRGVSQAYILVDLPYGSYTTPTQTLETAQQLVANGADGVKLEGLYPELVTLLVEQGIEVCGHLGLMPQSHEKKSVQGKTYQQAKEIFESSLILEQAGISLLLLELIPEEVAQLITEKVRIPTIGIGSGRYTDAQVLIVNDILGLTPRQLKLAKRYGDFQTLTRQIIEQYKQEVESIQFPAAENVWHMDPVELAQLTAWIEHH